MKDQEKAVEKMMRESPETEGIRRRMEEVRRDLDEDVQEIVEGARDMGEWRSYVRTYPWVCLGTALAVGFLIVPRRRSGLQPTRLQPIGETLAELANQSRLLANSHGPPNGNARGILLAFARNLVMRTVSSYVEQQVGKLFASQAAKSQEDNQP